MKRAVLGLAVALLLGACGQVKQETEMRMDLLDIRSVEFPPSVVADEPLNIIVEIGRACDRAFGQFRATRTATALDLQAFTKTYAVSAPVPPCPPVIILEKHTYTDHGTPTRTDPFEVIVNGKSYGTVNIK
ncbi:hypothetical protein [Deinococcus arenicola]|uniref:Lipoprotein n=1 Tax=Deinococcus arenicola TaxID=2994950 RepID=A0ABU4DSZ0_9DEIO|nr:hypothetical protein [Deinococcus sp. ZS9-10]MDV6375548.1 hypothetical protein [Deinococcus sp. ZS9-10]